MLQIHSKKGFVTYRTGGSAGDNGATAEQLQFFKKNPGCFPTVAGATLHLYVGGGKWRVYYISPYERFDRYLVAVWGYSTPQMGGHFKFTRIHSEKFPEFFDRMSKCRSTMARVLLSLHENEKRSISPRASVIQEKYTVNALNEEHSQKRAPREKIRKDYVSDNSSYESSSLDSSVDRNEQQDMLLGILNRQVIYSFVAYTVGNHKDVTKTNVAKELIECKAFLQWSSKCMPQSSCPTALGRGGLGHGKFTVMIVDHPEK
jgi:hypothetical protein